MHIDSQQSPLSQPHCAVLKSASQKPSPTQLDFPTAAKQYSEVRVAEEVLPFEGVAVIRFDVVACDVVTRESVCCSEVDVLETVLRNLEVVVEEEVDVVVAAVVDLDVEDGDGAA